MLVEGVFDALAGLAGGRPTAAMVGLTMREEWWSAIPARSLILAVDNRTVTGSSPAGPTLFMSRR